MCVRSSNDLTFRAFHLEATSSSISMLLENYVCEYVDNFHLAYLDLASALTTAFLLPQNPGSGRILHCCMPIVLVFKALKFSMSLGSGPTGFFGSI